MKHLILNVGLGLIWALLVGGGLGGLAAGLLVGFLVIAAGQSIVGGRRYVRAVLGSARLAATFVFELIKANLRLARDVLRPRPPFSPAILRFDAHCLGPAQTVMLANLISLTPGSITVDTDDAGEALYVHTLYAADPDRVRAELQHLADGILRAAGRPAESEA